MEKMMTQWNNEIGAFFYADEKPRRILLTTFGLDAEFLGSELLSTLLQVNEERESTDWFLSLQNALKECPVDVFVDERQWCSGKKSTLFQSLGGVIHTVDVSGGNQHSKLWMAEYESSIRIAIGSTNLTRAAFCNQVQYIWVAELEKCSQISSNNSGRLKNFLRCLYKEKNKCADNLRLRKGGVDGWCKLLDRVIWPKNITLIPVIPSRSKTEPSALEFLNQALPKNKSFYLDIQVFSVGELSEYFMKEVSEKLRVNKKTIHLWWPNRKTNLALNWKGMGLSESTSTNWKNQDAYFFTELKFTDFVEPHNRMPHGKLYAWHSQEWKRGKKAQFCDWLLIGSSNFSETAWKKSFELNVLIKGSCQLPLSFETYGSFDSPYYSEQVAETFNSVAWLEAWEIDNGVRVTLFGKGIGKFCVEILGSNGNVIASQKMNQWREGNSIEIKCAAKGARRVEVSKYPDLGCDIIPKTDTQLERIDSYRRTAEEIRHEWILKKYGWQLERFCSSTYRVEWVDRSLTIFKVIDNWKELGKHQEDQCSLKEAFCYFSKNESFPEISTAFSIAAEEIVKW